MAKLPLGLEACAYINFGTSATPDWKEITVIKDVTLNLEKGEADVSMRGSDWEQVKATLKKASIDFDMIWLDVEDVGDLANEDIIVFEKLLETFLAKNESLDMMFLSGPLEHAGSRGLRGMFDVFKFARDEKLTEALKVSCTVKPTYGTVKPKWVTMSETP